MRLKQFNRVEEYYNFLEKEIETLFKKEGIGICKDRYCNTISYLTENSKDKIATYCRRLIQGGVYIYICNDNTTYTLLSNITDDGVQGLYVFDDADVKKAVQKAKDGSITSIVNALMLEFNPA